MLFDAYAVDVMLSIGQLSVNAVRGLPRSCFKKGILCHTLSLLVIIVLATF